MCFGLADGLSPHVLSHTTITKVLCAVQRLPKKTSYWKDEKMCLSLILSAGPLTVSVKVLRVIVVVKVAVSYCLKVFTERVALGLVSISYQIRFHQISTVCVLLQKGTKKNCLAFPARRVLAYPVLTTLFYTARYLKPSAPNESFLKLFQLLSHVVNNHHSFQTTLF